MYFDHVRCSSCGAQFDPESIDSSGGHAACPSCKGQLDIKSLFGVAAQFEGADGPNAGIDDLVAGYGKSDDSWRQTSAVDPLNPGGAAQSGQRQSRPPRQAPSGRGTSMVHRAKEDDDSPTSSVLKALRDIKKGR
ncbi:MAG: DNA-directed RNA polymerase subunit RPC12/RpoP [Kiritimatiellia bacterium]|jgi:DNA-directed RNA polymerase subunit RPC12/RpoP